MDRLEQVKSFVLRYRSAVAGVCAIVVFALVLLLARGVGTQETALLYSGLDDTAAGEVIAALEAQGVSYSVRGSSIFVAPDVRDIVRMRLAAENLPRATTQGYELLDSLSGFGTTSQMFDAAYLRAKEGELARTILSNPAISAARVHISSAPNRPFGRQTNGTAAVTITAHGNALTNAQVQALRYLVASAMAGLSPEDVSVIDSVRGLIRQDDGIIGSDKNEAMRLRVQHLLEARVGPGNAVVEIAVETVTDSEQIIERRIDPDSRVAISSDVQESSSTSQDSRGGSVTVASNLPTGDAATDGSSSGEITETHTLTNFELSETQHEIIRAPGAIKRITVAVLVNEMTGPDGAGLRDDAELAALRDLVASAVGFDETRGDQISLHAMPFEPLPELGTTAVNVPSQPLDLMRLIQLGVLAVVTLILGLFVVRPLLFQPRVSSELVGSTEENSGLALPEPPMQMALDDFSFEEPAEEPAERLRRMIGERQRESLKILQSWVDSPEVGGRS